MKLWNNRLCFEVSQRMFLQAAGYNQTVTRYCMLNTER